MPKFHMNTEEYLDGGGVTLAPGSKQLSAYTEGYELVATGGDPETANPWSDPTDPASQGFAWAQGVADAVAGLNPGFVVPVAPEPEPEP